MKMKGGKERQSKPCPKVPQKHKEVKKWSTGEISLLIDLLEDRVCLWDVFDKSYHCRGKRGKSNEGNSNRVPDPWFQARPCSHFEMLSQMLSEKFSRLATPYSTTLNNTQHDSTLFSEMLSEKLSRLARPLVYYKYVKPTSKHDCEFI